MNNQTLTASVNDRILSILKDISNTTNLIGTYGIGFDVPTSYTVPMFWLRMTDNRLKPEEPGEFLYITYNIFFYDNIGNPTSADALEIILDKMLTYDEYLQFTITPGIVSEYLGKGIIMSSAKFKIDVSYMLALEDSCCNVLKIEGQPGERGLKGDSAYQAWIDLGNSGTEQDFIDSLKGEDGQNGTNGTDGDSAYQIWLDEGNTGTEQDFIDSLKGEQGLPGTDGASDWVDITNKPTTIAGFGITDAYSITNPAGFISNINGITAGGDLSGTYPNPSLVNSAVINKILTGLNITGGTILDTDSILSAFGKIQNQVNGLIGGTTYKGLWNASTNSPALVSSVGTNGNYYIVSVAGSTNLNGITDWNVGDWAIFHGGTWQKVDNTDAVVSVNGFTGAINLTSANIPEVTNLYYTNARVKSYGDTQWSLLGHTHDASDVVSGIFNTARLGSGIPSSSNFLRGDGTWATLLVPVEATVSEINTGTDNTNYVSSLGLEGSKYLEQDNSKLYAVTTGTATAYVLTTTPSFTPVNGTVLYVKFHLANTGAATINVNGSGAIALQKDLSTALIANDIPLNQDCQLRKTSTGWLITDIGFAGRNTSARLLGALTDATGTGVAMFGTTPTVTTSILGSTTFAAFNTVSTNLSIGGAATTFTLGGTPTTALTATLFGNATANTITKTLNIGTGGASGSITAINIGSATSGATNNVRLNITPASDATGDIFFRNASGFIQRLAIGTVGQVLTVASGLPSWAAASGGGTAGWALNGNSGLTPGTDFIGNTDAKETWFRNNGNLRMVIGVGSPATYPTAGNMNGASLYIAAGDNAGKHYGIVMGSDSGTGNGYLQAMRTDGSTTLYNMAIQPLGGQVVIGATTATTGYKLDVNGDVAIGSVLSTRSASPLILKSNGYEGIRLTTGASVTIGEYGSMSGASNVGMGYQTSVNGSSCFAFGTLASSAGNSSFAFGFQASVNASHSMHFNCTGTTATHTVSNQVKFSTPNGVVIESTTGGLLPPRMTDAQIRAIPSPTNGLLAYNTTLEKLCVYESGTWKQVVTTLM